MQVMLAEYERNIETVKRILKKLRAKSHNGEKDYEITQYETMLGELRQKAGQIKAYLGKE